MSGLLFLLSLIAFGVVTHWAYVNDRAGGGAAGRLGLLAMRDGDGEGADAGAGAGASPPWRGRPMAPDSGQARWRSTRRR